jgi:predicted ATPase
MDNTIRNEGKQALVSALLIAASNSQPLLAIIEDVHWADTITLAHLSALTKTVAECPALLVMTSRIEGDQIDQSWRNTTDGSPIITIDLGPLRKQDSMALIGEFIDTSDSLEAAHSRLSAEASVTMPRCRKFSACVMRQRD